MLKYYTPNTTFAPNAASSPEPESRLSILGLMSIGFLWCQGTLKDKVQALVAFLEFMMPADYTFCQYTKNILQKKIN